MNLCLRTVYYRLSTIVILSTERAIMRTLKVTSAIFLLIIAIMVGCSDATTTTMKPEKVHRFIYIEKPHEWYQEQSGLWKQIVEENRRDANAWYNYFMATRYSYWQSVDRHSRILRFRENPAILNRHPSLLQL